MIYALFALALIATGSVSGWIGHRIGASRERRRAALARLGPGPIKWDFKSSPDGVYLYCRAPSGAQYVSTRITTSGGSSTYAGWIDVESGDEVPFRLNDQLFNRWKAHMALARLGIGDR